MKTTQILFSTSLIAFAVFFLNAVPLAAQENLKINQTTVGGPGTSKLCIREYGKTPAEAFAAGAKIVAKADSLLKQNKLHGNVRIRILPKKEKGLFVVEVYSFPENKGFCPVRTDYLTAQVNRK